MFFIGQKVVCVAEPSAWLRKDGEAVPQKDQVYTVRGIIKSAGLVGLFLEEILNPAVDTWDGPAERPFVSRAFRPVINRSTESGFAILKKLENPQHHKNLERV